MSKLHKAIIAALITIIISYFSYLFIYSIKHQHKVEMYNYKRYFWLFKDDAIKEIDTSYYTGFIRDKDILCNYTYKNIEIFIWEFLDLANININNILISNNLNINELATKAKEILNKNNIPEINVLYELYFNKSLNISISKNSIINNYISSVNYKGFYGVLNKMSFSNNFGEHQILFDYGKNYYQTLLILFNKNGRFFVIIFNAKTQIDENIFNILHLN